MRRLDILLSLFLLYTCTATVQAQIPWQQDVRLHAVQADMVLFVMGETLTGSVGIAADIDILSRDYPFETSQAVGVQLGINSVEWPQTGSNYSSTHYRTTDFDLLGRYTMRSGVLRSDLLAGFTLRDGEYYIPWSERGPAGSQAYEPRLFPGVKIGGAVTLMLLRPVLALRFKASAFFFGYRAIEAGAIGLGIVTGWQRDP